MADIKINEENFLVFLNIVEQFVSDHDELKKEFILNFIQNERTHRELLLQRNKYYTFYKKQVKANPDAAAQSYKLYKEIDKKLKGDT